MSRRDGFVDVLTGDGVLRLFDVELQGGTAVPPNQIMTVEATLGVNDMHGLDYIALRYFNVYGPRMDLHGADTEVLVRWMEAIAHGRPPVIFGDGQQRMDFVNVDDVARANVVAAAAPVTDVALYIGSGVETSLSELARLLLTAMDSSLVPEHRPARQTNPVPRLLAEVGEARRTIGFASRIALSHGLRRLVAWWQEDQCAKRR